jgi:molybdopterin/thiamine biosynthesis adenylyltransferase
MTENEDRFDRQRLIPGWDQKALQRTCFFIAGAGALGNEIAKNLAMLGAERLIIVDMDLVEESNLNRATFFDRGDIGSQKVEALRKKIETQFPHCKVEAHDCTLQELPEEKFETCDIVFGCVDNQEARFLLNSYSVYYRKPYIDGATDGFLGQVRVVVPPYTACMECHLPTSAYQDIGERFSCTREQLEELGLPEKHIPALPTTTSIISAVAADEALKIVMGLDGFRADGSWPAGIGSPVDGVLQYDARTSRHNVVSIDKNGDCHICGVEGIRATEDLFPEFRATARLTLKGLYRQVARRLGNDEQLMLTHGLACRPDGREFNRMANDIDVKLKMALGKGYGTKQRRGGDDTGRVSKEELRVRELRRLASRVSGESGVNLTDDVSRLRSWLRGETGLAEYGISSGSVLSVVRQSPGAGADFNILLK